MGSKTVTTTSTGTSMVTGMTWALHMFHLLNREVSPRFGGGRIAPVGHMLQIIMRRFGTTAENVKEMRGELSRI